MSSEVPALVGADLRLAAQLERLLAAAAPLEGCALLLGVKMARVLVVQEVWPCCNRWPMAEERGRRFAIDPREQLLAQKWARQHQMAVLGFAHSHPSSPPVPSAMDLALCVAPALLAIQGIGAPGNRACLAWWWIGADGAEPLRLPTRLPWRMGG
ncbi:MAG: Mov34/MPN/PAD-1 family protein [Cyanobium sp. LacPavin_0920_WC12_MAG_62_9]|nr:Mov34/MPN/PAD-1 family protein [Cyanobium sp. LacPavin_0920_WC12_MAG_62_9]